MSRTCTVCAHPKRESIDRALVNGESNRVISRQYTISHDAVQRHRRSHLPEVLTKAAEARDVARADDLLDRLEALNHETQEILREARAEGRKGRGVALLAIARAEKQIELQARLLGELRDGATVNVLVASAEWADLQARILAALAPCPDAWAAVAAAIEDGQMATNGRPSAIPPRALQGRPMTSSGLVQTARRNSR